MTEHPDLYVDGGVIGKNPSAHGGTFAWCLVQNNQVKTSGSGIILPVEFEGFQKISNNVSELVAALEGLQATLIIQPEWEGTLWTDSLVTLRRLLGSQSFKGVPVALRTMCLELRRARKWTARLLAGHPSRKMLSSGFNERGTPVSTWNVWCDKECQRLSRQYLDGRRK
jgi:ribonuclease HI